MREPMAWILGVVLTGCSASSGPAIGDAAPACEPGVHYTCSCGPGRAEGRSLCSQDGLRGGCECGSVGGTDASVEAPPDASCAQQTAFFRDTDGDGYGSGVPTTACTAPAGYVPRDGDCDDTDARVFPGQTAFFDAPRANGSFDLDCNGAETRENTELGACDLVRGANGVFTCAVVKIGMSWSGPIPGCGETGQWLAGCSSGCGASLVPTAQKCR